MVSPNGAGTSAVEVDGLVKRFGDFTAVDGISFSVEPGELFGFLGPNGAGKTTTISVLCTLLHPTGGEARVAGHDVVNARNEVRSNIGLVFQDVTLDDYLTGEENLRFHAVLYGLHGAEIKRRMDPLLDMVGLTDWASQQARFYSGGMKRRLEIARGLLHTPRVLFLDEPTIGLDPQTRVHIWDYVDELREPRAHDDVPHHPLHGRGGAVRPHRDHRPGPHRRDRLAGRAEGLGRRRHGDHRDRRRPHRPRRDRTRAAAWRERCSKRAPGFACGCRTASRSCPACSST